MRQQHNIRATAALARQRDRGRYDAFRPRVRISSHADRAGPQQRWAVQYTYVLKHEVVLCEDGETVMVYLFFGVTIRTRSMSPTSIGIYYDLDRLSMKRTSMRVRRRAPSRASCNRSIRGWPSASTECRSLLPRSRRRSAIIQTGVRDRFHPAV